MFHCDGWFSHSIGLSNLSTATLKETIIFALDGGYVGRIGTKGSDRSQLFYPSSVAVDKYGFILVIEGVNIQVSIFDKAKGSAKGQFHSNESLGIALSPNGSIYISEYYNKRIQIFSNLISWSMSKFIHQNFVQELCNYVLCL